ncbi:MAG: hypothetical protein HYU71_06490 [Bacteroidetes bacterium]|nr:hypothetical protein [Bacteroidota bacterium]
MKIIRNSIFGILFLLAACQGGNQEEKAEENKAADTVKMAESIRTNLSYLNDYNALEQLFSNDNWLIPGTRDSSYLYVSRLGNYVVKTYAYQLVKGDSAHVQHADVKTENDQLVWQFNGQKLYLTSATRARAVFAVVGADSLQYEFVRLDDNKISLTYPDKKKVVMKKMLQFSLFLARSRYDFTNGTKYAFDTTQFNKKKE